MKLPRIQLKNLVDRYSTTVGRTGISLIITLLFMLHAVNMPAMDWLSRLENLSYDLRLRATLTGGVDDRIVIADIDEASLESVGRWPWPRDILAEIVDTLFDHYEIQTLGFDVIFAEPDTDRAVMTLDAMAQGALKTNREFQREYENIRSQLERDRLFAESIADRNVVLGFVFDRQNEREVNVLPTPLAPLSKEAAHVVLVEPKGFTGNLPVLQEAARAGGFFDNPLVDADGVYRRVPLVQLYNDQLYESLSMGVARLTLGAPPFSLHLEQDRRYRFVDEVQLGPRRIPLEPEAAALVPYRGPAGSFPYVSMADILEKRVSPEILKERIVLVGTTAPGLLDLRTTPVQSVYPGVEVHANLIAGILDGTIKHHPGWMMSLEFLLAPLLGALVTFFSLRLSPVISFAAATLLAGTIIGINFFAWNKGLVLPLASPLMLLIILFVVHTILRLITETQDRAVITRLFGQYIPPELVDEIADNPDSISLAGESREMTVLFSDVRGFTSISEGLEPEALTLLMNELLTPLTRVIHQHRGTIDKYMGDAIMAFWGAPLEDPEHGLHALEAAEDMMRALDEINQKFRMRRWPEINIGIGLNTGIMSVGNMGSEFRMAYTVLGDAVNLGSRLEGLTKAYGVNIIVSESTRRSVKGFAFRELDLVRVKGKQKPVAIYEPIGKVNELSDSVMEQLVMYEQAIVFYRQQKWDKADALFLALRGKDLAHKVYTIYLERIGAFRKQPPPPDWDGVFTHTSK